MEGYLEIFGRIFCGKKGNFGLWRRKCVGVITNNFKQYNSLWFFS
jgi:hypothetical protein